MRTIRNKKYGRIKIKEISREELEHSQACSMCCLKTECYNNICQELGLKDLEIPYKRL